MPLTILLDTEKKIIIIDAHKPERPCKVASACYMAYRVQQDSEA